MTREQKDLLLRDLSARLPYRVKVKFSYIITSPAVLKGINEDLIECDIAVCELEDIKPYLFPLSSMTKEELREYNYLYAERENNNEGDDIEQYSDLIDWFNKNHFDYRGLIPMDLAIDATGLNIY